MPRPVRAVSVLVASCLVALTGCGGVEVPAAPPVPTGPTGTHSPPPPDPSFQIGGPTPTHTTPAPTAYPGLSITGKTVCDIFDAENLTRFQLADPDTGDDTVCFFDGVGSRKRSASDTVVYLTPATSLAAWAGQQPAFTRWTTLTTDGTTGLMSAGNSNCQGAFAVAPDAVLQVEVRPEEQEPLCARATEILKAALAGLRALQ